MKNLKKKWLGFVLVGAFALAAIIVFVPKSEAENVVKSVPGVVINDDPIEVYCPGPGYAVCWIEVSNPWLWD